MQTLEFGTIHCPAPDRPWALSGRPICGRAMGLLPLLSDPLRPDAQRPRRRHLCDPCVDLSAREPVSAGEVSASTLMTLKGGRYGSAHHSPSTAPGLSTRQKLRCLTAAVKQTARALPRRGNLFVLSSRHRRCNSSASNQDPTSAKRRRFHTHHSPSRLEGEQCAFFLDLLGRGVCRGLMPGDPKARADKANVRAPEDMAASGLWGPGGDFRGPSQ